MFKINKVKYRKKRVHNYDCPKFFNKKESCTCHHPGRLIFPYIRDYNSKDIEKQNFILVEEGEKKFSTVFKMGNDYFFSPVFDEFSDENGVPKNVNFKDGSLTWETETGNYECGDLIKVNINRKIKPG